jgi:hypothetical protein
LLHLSVYAINTASTVLQTSVTGLGALMLRAHLLESSQVIVVLHAHDIRDELPRSERSSVGAPVSHDCIDYHFLSSTLLLAPGHILDLTTASEQKSLPPSHPLILCPLSICDTLSPFLTFGRDDQHKPQGCGTRTSLVPSHSYSQFFFHSFDFSFFVRSAQR